MAIEHIERAECEAVEIKAARIERYRYMIADARRAFRELVKRVMANNQEVQKAKSGIAALEEELNSELGNEFQPQLLAWQDPRDK